MDVGVWVEGGLLGSLMLTQLQDVWSIHCDPHSNSQPSVLTPSLLNATFHSGSLLDPMDPTLSRGSDLYWESKALARHALSTFEGYAVEKTEYSKVLKWNKTTHAHTDVCCDFSPSHYHKHSCTHKQLACTPEQHSCANDTCTHLFVCVSLHDARCMHLA